MRAGAGWAVVPGWGECAEPGPGERLVAWVCRARASRSRCPQAEEERDDMERVKLDNKRILFNLLPAHVAQHFLTSNPRSMVRARPPWRAGCCAGPRAPREVPPQRPARYISA